MIKRITPIVLLLAAVTAGPAFAGKKATPAPQYPSEEKQQAFTQQYYEALDGGKQAASDFVNNVMNKPGADGAVQARMLDNLMHGKAADGGAPKGFRGDPKDKGPSDWSDWDIQTDKDGNVTGFKERDFEQKDKDGDGKISKEERDAWNKKKADEDKERGGPMGGVKRNPDWDKDGDGKPDPGFSLDCYQCKMPKGKKDEDEVQCHGSELGPCGEGSCGDNQSCEQYAETDSKGQSYFCHNCEDKSKNFCLEHGYADDPSCAGGCEPGDRCVPVDVNKEDGSLVGATMTRAKGSTLPCFMCEAKRHIHIEITYVIYIIETPFERYILGNNIGISNFVPAQVMALAKATKGPGGITQLAGMMPGLGGMSGLLNPTTVNLQQLSGMLQQGLQKGGKYDGNCFAKDFKAQDRTADAKPPAASSATAKDKTANHETFGDDPLGRMSTGGPVLACGQQGGEKALSVMDASGKVVDVITQSKLKKDPNAVMNAISKAQSASDAIMQIRQQGIAAFLQQKAVSMAQGFVQKMTQKAVDQAYHNIVDAKKNPKGKKNAVPNDPYYAVNEDAKPKKKTGVASAVPSIMGGMMGGGGGLGGGGSNSFGINMGSEQDRQADVKYQWGLHAIGYTPLDDPNSAWNFVDKDNNKVLVAIIDSGLDMSHPDAPQYIWTNAKEIPGNGIDDDGDGFIDDVHGWNFLNDNNDLTDEQGHGSFVAGIIAAKWNNGIGIAGINPGAMVMPIKVADKDGHANSYNIFRAVHYAVDHGAKVISISLGAHGVSQLEREAINYAKQMGVFVAVASGNVGENIDEHGPASSPGAFAVGSFDLEGTRSTISNFGPNNGLLAPGDKIISLIASGTGKKLKKSYLQEGYYPQSGTSFSTPMVAATASLLLAQNPQLTPDDIEDILDRSADRMGDANWDEKSGAGRLNASAALQHIAQRPMTIKFNEFRYNLDANKKFVSLDVFVTVRGAFSSYRLALGKGKRPSHFDDITGVISVEADDAWVVRIDRQLSLKGSNDWVIKLLATGRDGKEYEASASVNFK